jgi:mono/diheme cytochrome c family protein
MTSEERRVAFKVTALTIAFITIAAARSADAGDARAGLQLAQRHCAVCHAVGRWQGEVFAEAPPFQLIARNHAGADLTIALRGPHQKMNFRPSQDEANDIAEYIRSLVQ